MAEVKSEPKRLRDLNPKWVRSAEHLIYGIAFDCPCGRPMFDDVGQEDTHCPIGRSCIPTKGNFLGEPQLPRSKEHGWDIVGGTSFDDISLSPSIHHVGHWHGMLTDGVLISC